MQITQINTRKVNVNNIDAIKDYAVFDGFSIFYRISVSYKNGDVRNIEISKNNDIEYLPRIYYDNTEEDINRAFEVATTSHGYLAKEGVQAFIEGYLTALQAVDLLTETFIEGSTK